jgi:Icc-related predicted phosphoesterase
LFLFAGDLVNRGNYNAMRSLLAKLRAAKVSCPIFACFGNGEFDTVKDRLRDIAKGCITFLDDELAIVEIGEAGRVAIVGSRGVLDQPTFWQARNIPGIQEHYTARLRRLDQLLGEARSQADYSVLLTHYAPTFSTIEGEPQRAFPQMGSQRVEKLLKQHSPTVAIHGHAHRGRKQAMVGSVPVFNVALPLQGEIVIIELPQANNRTGA